MHTLILGWCSYEYNVAQSQLPKSTNNVFNWFYIYFFGGGNHYIKVVSFKNFTIINVSCLYHNLGKYENSVLFWLEYIIDKKKHLSIWRKKKLHTDTTRKLLFDLLEVIPFLRISYCVIRKLLFDLLEVIPFLRISYCVIRKI